MHKVKRNKAHEENEKNQFFKYFFFYLFIFFYIFGYFDRISPEAEKKRLRGKQTLSSRGHEENCVVGGNNKNV